MKLSSFNRIMRYNYL